MLDLARRRLPATLVSGPPGAGKTTLVSSYLEARNLPCLWYQVDSGDDDVATFFHYLSFAANSIANDPTLSLPDFDPGTAIDLVQFSRRYFREYYLARGAPPVLVLDNYHELATDSAMHEVIRVACEETPAEHHIVIVSRSEPPPSLARMRLNRALMIIDADDLALTLDETRGIAQLRGVKLPSASATLALHVRSAGWIMGLMLVLECLRRNGRSSPAVAVSAGQEQLLFDYFAGEVFRAFDIECRRMLSQMALLPEMTVHRVVQLSGNPKAGVLLRELMRKNQFVMRHEGKEAAYQFHPLFRQFLLDQGERFFGTTLAEEQCKAAEVLIMEGDYEAALELLEQARNWPRMASVILEAAPLFSSEGRDATVALWLNKLPADSLCAEPWLAYWQASSKVTSDPEGSLALFDETYRRFRASDDLLGMALSWSGLINVILMMHKDLRQIDGWIEEFDRRIGGRLEELPTDLSNRVAVAHFNALSFRQPLHPQMAYWLQKVLAQLELERRAVERAVLRHHVVRYHLLRGDHVEAESTLGMLHHDDRVPASTGELRPLMDYVSDAIVALHVGAGERCFRAVREGLKVAEARGDRLAESILLQTGAAMSLNRGESMRADAALASIERLAEALPFVDRGTYYAVSAWRKYQKGEHSLALQLQRRAVTASEGRGTAYYIAADNLGYGLLLHLCGENAPARRHLEIGRAVGVSINNPLIDFAYHLFAAYMALEARDGSAVVDNLARGLRIGREHGYMHFFYFPPKVIARLCMEALDLHIESAYVHALIQRNELTPDPAWRQSQAWPWPIRIYTLGRFNVVQDGRAMRFAGKAQKKPLELLKALIALGGRDVPEARLADVLWPEAEGDAAAQAFATTLFRLRKLIGEQAIRRQEGRVTLDQGVCWVDCWEFERVASDDSLDPPLRLEKLQRLYQGGFLEGTDAAPWAQPLRERLYARLARLGRELPALLPWYLLDMLVF